MCKFALLPLIVVVSFGFAGCVSNAEWSKGLREVREATICDKEIVQVSTPDTPGMTQPEHRIQLTWNDVERGANLVAWSIVSDKTYQMFNVSDKVSVWLFDFGRNKKGHVTVIYYWTDDRMLEICEFKYEYDLPEE